MRILVIIAIVVILYMIIKSLIGKNTKLNQKTKKNISYCQDCDTYMPCEELCKTKKIHFEKCENYKRNS